MPFSACAAQTAASAVDPSRPLGATACLDNVEDRILEIVNSERAKVRFAPVLPEPTLRAIARNHDDDILGRRFFSHINPSGEGPDDRIQRQHRRLIGVTGENIWESSGEYAAQQADLAGEIMKGWMGSPGHRENILRAEFTHLGVGVCAAGREIRATQDFAAIQAVLHTPLPASVQPGWQVFLSVEGGKKFAELFDLWSKTTRAPATKPAAVTGARIEAPPGVYVVRFYFERAPNSFNIFDGPSLEVR